MMLVFLLCVIMKIAELSIGRDSPSSLQSKYPPPYYKKLKRYRFIGRNNYITNYQKRAGKEVEMMDDPQTPGSDCNSNPADPISQDLIGSEFIQDNSDYQWFLDYGYRDGGLHVHQSVLSSLSTSYTQDDLLGYYDDLARNLDANLAEVDMESFRTADIHTLLTTLPVMCTDPVQQSEFNYQRERYASISGSVMEKIDIGSSISPHSSSQGEDSACSTTDTISICKSSLLFSPVKETPVLPPGGSYSVDSLDCEDMLLTCQANNKNNYTIAFEGSMTMYSDGSQDFENQEKNNKVNETRNCYYNPKIDLKNMIDYSMACSDSKVYTTWSNLKQSSTNKVIQRHGSGNNNTLQNFLQTNPLTVMLNANKRSLSLPDLRKSRDLEPISIPLNFSMDSAESNHQNSSSSGMSRSVNESSNSNTSSGKKLQNMSLVKLFMKQKSMSAEGMSLTLDQSDTASENGWPTSNNGSESATNTNTNTNTQIHRMNINETCKDKDNITDNDFSINWVKTDCYKNSGTSSSSCHDDNINNKRNILSVKQLKEESPSVEELSESIMKSDLLFDKIKINLNEQNEKTLPKNIKKAWYKTTDQESIPISKTTGTQVVKNVEENGVQTSLLYVLSTKNNISGCIKETFIDRKPVYVVYPNYTLPDLSFLNMKDGNLENVSLKPQERISVKKTNRNNNNNRPFSCNDVDALKQRGFSHVKDWESLTFLLPTEYRKILHDVPEIPRHIKLNEEMKKPLFCLSPPMRHRTRTISEITNPINVSSSSSTGTQPSSGYRGSSTILTDSSSNNQTGNTVNPLYLYRYDSGSSETSLIGQDKKYQRPASQTKPGGYYSKRSLSLPHGETDNDNNNTNTNKIPPRPPLPRSILRKNRTTVNKRYSMFEMGGVEEVEDYQNKTSETNKRMSLQEPYYINNDVQLLRHGKIIDSDKDVDEVEERRYAERMKELENYDTTTDLESSEDDVKQLEEFLKRSGFSSNSSDDSEDLDIKLRSNVRRFLALKMNKDLLKNNNSEMIESQKKTVSFALKQKKLMMNDDCNVMDDSDWKMFNLDDKNKLIMPVNKSIDMLISYWHSQSDSRNKDFNDCPQMCLTQLCPALYAIMSDGLKLQLSSSFGPISNSVWQVVEASSQQGPLTNTLNELVQKINTEDFMTEGMVKFNAFLFGLLNLRALDAWFAYLCTRETILRKHYSTNSLFVAALGCANSRELIDNFLTKLQPLAFCPFQLDIFYQYRQLHNSFNHPLRHNNTNHNNNNNNINNNNNNNINTNNNINNSNNNINNNNNININELPKELISSPKRLMRPKSCCYDDKRGSDSVMKKRWSNLAIGSKVSPLLDKLADDSEEYTDSLEHSPLNRANRKQIKTSPSNHLDNDEDEVEDDDSIPKELKFKKLQEKWEFIVNKEEQSTSSPNNQNSIAIKSKIPRLLTSPVKQLTNNFIGKTKSPVTGIPCLRKPSPVSLSKPFQKKSIPDQKINKDIPKRTSRVDQEHASTSRTHLTRPSSLPYKYQGFTAKDKGLISPQRRAASTSLPRPYTPISNKTTTKRPVKEVRTLTHRLPSDNGHLSFNEGDRLKVILEVDNKWLLCAKGDRKGLVPRACVHYP